VENLRSIAIAFHSGKHPKEIDFGNPDLTPMEQLKLVYTALRKYPTPESVSDGSNEIVLPIEEDQPTVPLNVHRFEIHTPVQTPARDSSQSSTPMIQPKAISKVRWKLKVGERRQKQRIYLRLISAEKTLQRSFEAFQAGEGAWEEVVSAHQEHVNAMSVVNGFIDTVHEDQLAYYWARSNAWTNSENAWAYLEWMEAWENEIPGVPLPDLKKDGRLELTAAKAFLALPDEPSL
jgi:hypothetical protein